MKNKVDKKVDFDAIRKALEESPNVFVAGFEKMTVAQDYALRKTVRAAGGRYRVLKNTLAEKAATGLSSFDAMKGLTGMNSMAYTSGDPVALAKALVDYAKTNPLFTFKAGVVEGRVVEVKSINDLATMPSKEEIYAKLLYIINAPATQLVSAINGVGRNLAVVIDQGVKENKFQQ
jgi:large subunit ribosomal protein L10